MVCQELICRVTRLAALVARRNTLAVLALPFPFLPLPGEKAPKIIGVDVKPGLSCNSSFLGKSLTAWRTSSVRMSVCVLMALSGALESQSRCEGLQRKPSPSALDHAFPQERPVLEVPRQVTVE